MEGVVRAAVEEGACEGGGKELVLEEENEEERGVPDWERAEMRFLGPMTQQMRQPGRRQFCSWMG